LPLRQSISTPEGKRRYVRRLFATIADRYDFITRFLSYGQDLRWKRRLIRLAALRPSDRVLDLACGTGDLLVEAALRARSAVGLDVTFRMTQLARRRAIAGDRAAGVSGQTAPHSKALVVTADMLALPFGTAAFDVVTTGYGLRNVPDLDQALREIHRVLAPGGRLVSLDFDRPENIVVRSAYLTYLTVVGSALGLALHRDPDTYRYIPESIRNYPGARRVARLMERHGFVEVEVLSVLGGLMAIHAARKDVAGPENRTRPTQSRSQTV
jgi:demethylmenaquinone methyltransferase/2-methoxy-6-polyprenyl-1,4-benzoquinol methylase